MAPRIQLHDRDGFYEHRNEAILPISGGADKRNQPVAVIDATYDVKL